MSQQHLFVLAAERIYSVACSRQFTSGGLVFRAVRGVPGKRRFFFNIPQLSSIARLTELANKMSFVKTRKMRHRREC